MNKLLNRLLSGILLSAFIPLEAHAKDVSFFSVDEIEFVDKPRPNSSLIFRENKSKKHVFFSYLDVAVKTAEKTRSDSVYAKIYYYNEDKKLIEKSEQPYPVLRDCSKSPCSMPIIFERGKTEHLYFAVPEKVLCTNDWRGVVIFGDKYGASASVFPSGFANLFSFPELKIVTNSTRVVRKIPVDPLIEHIVRTGNKKQPQITLFMKTPTNILEASESKGVLAMCLLANDVEDIRRRLQLPNLKDEVGGLLRFAEKEKLFILCWGSRSLWDPNKNWDEQSNAINRQMDETFDDVAAAWSQGVMELSKKYGLPQDRYLLWGISGAAQYAHRLALRQPKRFLAVHIHVPSSFDKPTKDASSILWCLTTGENEGGYDNSLKFFLSCKEMGYPILYKAIPGLGHQGSPIADRIGLAFFEYALSIQKENELRVIHSNETNDASRSRSKKLFFKPPFWGDIINQQIYPDAQCDLIPPKYRVSIPTKALAKAWSSDNFGQPYE